MHTIVYPGNISGGQAQRILHARTADCIIVIDAGVAVESGTYGELIAKVPGVNL